MPPWQQPLHQSLSSPQRGADAGFDAEASDQRARLRAESVDASTIEKFNRLLYTSERLLTREEGLPGRPWYRH